MNKINYHPISQEGASYIRALCPSDAHIHVTMVGVWADLTDEEFGNKFMSSVTTHNRVVRAISYNGGTYWTLEQWTHDNGYRCTLTVLTKAEFLSLIRS